MQSGVLLCGVSGSGKTLLASAVAGESELNFISIKVEFVGRGSSFRMARKSTFLVFRVRNCCRNTWERVKKELGTRFESKLRAAGSE